MRIFTAVEFDGNIKSKISELRNELCAKGISGNFTSPGNLHLTLKFLGEVEPSRLSELKTALENSAGKIPAFEISAEGCGYFTSRGDKTIWLGMTGAGLSKLAEKIDIGFSEIGFERENRAFTPHVTLVRRADCGRDLIKQTDVQDIKFRVEFATLFESRRDAGKLWYKPLFRAKLKGKTT